MATDTSPNNLQALRDRAKLSRSQLGRLADLEGQTIYRIENGASVRIETAHRLARALSEALGEQVSVEDIFPEPAEATA